MQPERLSLGNLLADRVPFRVPIYQRAYAWERDEIIDFVGDIAELYDARLAKVPKQHFFGGMVSVYSLQMGSKTGGMYEVVDGQQRMATFVLAIALILRSYRKIALQASKESDEETERLARSTFEVENLQFVHYQAVGEGGNKIQPLRLTLSKADAVYFERLIEGRPPAVRRDSHKRLRDAARRIERGLVSPILDSGLPARDKWDKLKELRAALTEDCYLIHIVSTEQTEAYRLFAILNDRGRSLSDGDLLRTRSLELLEGHSALQSQAETHWDEILGARPGDIDGFLRSYFASHVGKRASKRELFDQFRNQFFKHSLPVSFEAAQAIADTIEELRDESQVYLKISDGEWPYEPASASAWERDRLFRLVKVLHREVTVPLLMSVHKCLSEKAFARAVEVLERLDFRYLICGGHAGSLGDRYYRQAQLIRQQGDSYDLRSLINDAEELVGKVAPDPVFAINLAEKIKYSARGTNAQLRHFLTTMDDYWAWLRDGATGAPRTDQLFNWNLSEIEIEHVYAQNSVERDADLEELKQDVGNLTYWSASDNKVASNAPFDVKRPAYARSRVGMNHRLAELPAWNRAALIARRRELIDGALAVFKLSTPSTGATGANLRVWLVHQQSDSKYEDREGRWYEYPSGIPNGKQVQADDVLICYRPGTNAEYEIFGVGHVAEVQTLGESRRATYDRYLDLDPAVGFGEVGGDPRNNKQNSINQAPPGFVESLLAAQDGLTLGDLPPVGSETGGVD